MKALTVWQPWASLIAEGLKPYEFRAWRPPASIVGQRIAIHAGARAINPLELDNLLWQLTQRDFAGVALREGALPFLRAAKLKPETLWRSSILATAKLGAPRHPREIAAEFGGAAANDSDRAGHFNWAWPLTEIERVSPPAPATGAQGFWEWRREAQPGDLFGGAA